MADIIITPASGLIDFQNVTGISSATIELDSDDILNISSAGGINLGDSSSDIIIGDGVNNVDIIFEQNGSIRGETGVTITLGQSGSFISFGGNITGNSVFAGRPAFNGGTSGSSSPFTVDSTQVVTNLNADLLDGINSASFLRSDDNDTFTGNLANNGSNYITFGPNATWSKFLRIGGNGYQGNTTTANIAATNGNLHIDAADGGFATYLNFYAGTAGVAFGNGDNGVVAWMGPDGDLWKGGSDNSGFEYWHAGNDGPNSGLNADLLDGNEASAFLTTSDTSVVKTTGNQSIGGTKTFTGRPAFNGGTSGSSSPFTVDSTQVVTNLNADLLDGNQASAFLTTSDTTVVKTTGNQSIGGTKTFTGIPVFNGGTSGSSAPFTVDSTQVVTNLNADLLDGISSGSFLRSDASDIYTGTLTGAGNISFTGSVIEIGEGSGSVAMTINDGYGNANLSFNHASGIPDVNGNAFRITTNVDVTTNATITFQGKSNVTANTAVVLTSLFTMSETGATCIGNTVWHAGNDGPGSDLNADLLDDQQGSYYLNYNNFTNTPTIPTNNNQLTNGAGYITNTITTDFNLGNGSTDSRILIKKADNNVSDHIQFFNGTTRIGEIGVQDDTWLRINQVTNKNIYTPRYIRADAGFFVDGTTKGINGSGNFIGGTIAGASDYNLLATLAGDQTFTGTKTFSNTIVGSINGSAGSATDSTNCSRQVIAGNGLTGGGTLNANRTLNVVGGANGGISVAADSISVDSTVIRTTGNQSIGGTKTFSNTIVGSINGSAASATDSTNCSRQVIAGNGLTGGGTLNANRTLNVVGGSNGGISVAADSISVDSTVFRTFGNQNTSGDKTFTGITETNQLRVGSTTGPTGSGNGTLVVAENIHINNAGAQDNNGRFQIYVGEQEDITASTGTIQFTFSTNPTTNRTSALLKITVSWQLNNNNILNQAAIEFMAQINNNTSGVVAIGDIQPIYEYRTTVASDVTFTNLNGGQCRFDVQAVVSASPNATYKVEILSRDGKIDLSSVSKT